MELQNRRQELQTQLQAARDEALRESRRRKPLLLSSSQWKAQALQSFTTLNDSGDLTSSCIHRLRDEACVAPDTAGQSLVKALDRIPASKTLACEN